VVSLRMPLLEIYYRESGGERIFTIGQHLIKIPDTRYKSMVSPRLLLTHSIIATGGRPTGDGY